MLAALNATLSGNILGGATNGTVQTAPGSGNFWSEVISTIFKVKRGNEVPNGLIWNSALRQAYETATDTLGQPLAMPKVLSDIAQFESNQIPSYTKGTMANVATDLFVGDWSQLLIGTRLEFSLRPLPDLFAGSGQVGVMIFGRYDIQVARSTAFSVYRALEGAA